MDGECDIAVLMACHNRREKTAASLLALRQSVTSPHVHVQLFLVDDASTDGTADRVLALWPDAHVLPGSGSLYWNGAMRLAFAEAMKRGFRHYLWLNDDTYLFPDTLQRMLDTFAHKLAATGRPSIVVGATRDPRTGQTTYGGVVRPSRLRRLHFERIEPLDEARTCESFNGNCVLVPHEVAQVLGNLDAAFVHSMGDGDYGLRARAAGFQIWLVAGHAGTCTMDHPRQGSHQDGALTVLARLRKVLSPKVLPISAWRVYASRHGGMLWPAYWLYPYIRVVVEGVLGDIGKFLGLRKGSSAR